jgi:hypothetical protein
MICIPGPLAVRFDFTITVTSGLKASSCSRWIAIWAETSQHPRSRPRIVLFSSMLPTPSSCTPLLVDRFFFSSLKIQRDKLKQYQKRVGAALLDRPKERRNTWQLICLLPFFRFRLSWSVNTKLPNSSWLRVTRTAHWSHFGGASTRRDYL